ncbi:MAG: hypothetical protein JW870_15725 [Candidatus Delongbacteria bacterium]|nr:hypothetical protein [Candidatus Delongbacteria bacterium]
MSTNLFISESKFLERSRIALTNAESHAEIKQALTTYGMDKAKLAVGWIIYNNSKSVWERNKDEDAESKIASNSYKAKYNDLQSLFKRHRDQTLIFFKKQPDILIKLGVSGKFPAKYNEFFDKVKLFYNGIKENKDIQTELNKIKITEKVVSDCLAKYDALLAERAHYDKELGESQDATKSKNAALLELKEWMEDFDAIAKVALYDQPQLLEALGIFVRS